MSRTSPVWRDAQEAWDAAASNQLEVLLKYLAKGADVTFSPPDGRGHTALHIAAARGFLDVVKALCRHDHTLLERQDDDGNTPITVAKLNQQPHVVYFLSNVKPAPGRQELPTDAVKPNFYRTGGLHCHRLALVIGQAHYKCQSLHHAASDAQLVSRRLQDLRFEVFVGVNLSRQELINQFNDFAAHVGPQDFAVVYYTGLAARRGHDTVLIGTDRLFGVNPEPALTVEHMSETLLKRRDKAGRPTMEQERGVSMILVNACYQVKDSSGPPVVSGPWHPGEPEMDRYVTFEDDYIIDDHQRPEEPEVGSTSLTILPDGHTELRFDYGRKEEWHVYENFRPGPGDRQALGGSDNSQFLVSQPSKPLDFRHPWREKLPIPFPMPRYESPPTRIYAAGFQSPPSASPIYAPPHMAASAIPQRDWLPNVREQGLHPVNVQGSARALVIYAHSPSEVLDEAFFDPAKWTPEDPMRSLLAPQEAQVQRLAAARLSFQAVVPTRLERLAPRQEEATPSSVHWVLPTEDVKWPYAVEKDHLSRYGGEYRYHGQRPATPLEKLGGDVPPPSLFAACFEETLGCKLHLREAVLKLGAMVTERSGRQQVPFLSLGTQLHALLL